MKHMMPPELSNFLDAVRQCVGRDRLAEILTLRDTPIEKEDGSYVTQGDLLVQRLINDLAQQHLGHHVLVSEEMTLDSAKPPTDAIVVVIDPIDGTENFTSGLVEWGVSISCYRNGHHLGSLIGAPELGKWLRTGEPLHRSTSRIRGLSSSLSREQIMEVGVGPEYRIIGCCVINMMYVVQGAFCSFENPKGAYAWDILAGFNLALEHGLSVEVDERKYEGEYLAPEGRYRFKVTGPDASI